MRVKEWFLVYACPVYKTWYGVASGYAAMNMDWWGLSADL